MSILPVGTLSGTLSPSEISSLSGASGITPTSPTNPTTPTDGVGQAVGATGASNDFSNTLGDALNSMQAAQTNADNLATQAATGSLTNVSDYMVAANEADIDTQMTVAVRNAALQSFQQIMGMQL